RETNDASTCSPGAYETLQADLFWIGEPFPQEMVDAAPQNIRVANYRQQTGSTLYEADMTWEIPDGVSYASILGQYSSDEGASWKNLGYVAKDATSRKATQITPGKEYQVRLRGVFADGSYTAWSVITYASPLELDGSDGEQCWELRLPTSLSVVNPSFQTSAGWATSRFAIVSGDVAPQVGQTLFIGRDVAFNAPPSGRIGALTVGGRTVLKFGGGTTTVSDLVAGIGVVLQGTPITGDRARLGDYFRAETSVFYTFTLTEVGASVYIGHHAAYSTVVSTAPTYGILQLLPSSGKRPTLSGNYVCADFRVRVNSNVNVLPVAVSGSATVRSTLFSLGTDTTSQYFERFFDGPVTLKLQGDATVGVPSPTRETWADNFTVDVSEATRATLTLSGQTVYGDAPTAEITLNGAAKIVERGLDVESLTLNADAALTVDGARGVVAELSVADGATVAFSPAESQAATGGANGTAGTAATNGVSATNGTDLTYVDAVLAATETATVGVATFAGTGYFATPQGTDLTAATFAEAVRVSDFGAGVADFTATATGPTTATLAWSATDATARVCVERESAAAPNGWEVVAVATAAESPLSVALSGRERFRVFDGATFTVDSADGSPLAPFWQVASWAVLGAETPGAPEDGDAATRFSVAAAWAVPVDRAV
ncbi:MAG: fibronectin type III domain-containing protein, partial [Thermoguttaceae bacterium]|nr:fibronectin type III domain-containing protein [Thermoguttaceae bacterium]